MRVVVAVAIAALACLTSISSASADGQEDVLLTLVAPSGGTNTLNVGLSSILGSDNENVGISGTVLAHVDVNPANGKINKFRLKSGAITTNNSFNLTNSGLFGTINAAVGVIGGDVSSDTPPTQYPVNGSNQFDATKHKVTLNTGTAVITGAANATVDFANTPINAAGTGNGTFSSSPNGNGYDVLFNLPLSAQLIVGSGISQATVTVSGNMVASGFYTTIPEPTSGLFLVSLAVIAGAGRRRTS